LPATPATKKALNTAVMTTVVYPELAKSYMLQAQTSRTLTSCARERDFGAAVAVFTERV
jgi:hypothetical protein